MKTCRVCEQKKVDSEFPVRQRRCKQCTAEYKHQWRLKNIDRVRANRKKRYWEDSEKAKREAMEWYHENHEKACEQRRDYHHRKRAEILPKKKEYYAKNAKVIGDKASLRYLYDDEFRRQATDRAKNWGKRHPEKRRKYHREYEQRPERKAKNKIRRLTNLAIRKGNLIAKHRCEFCQSERRVEIHHLDYDDPLNVLFLCKRCHMKVHVIERMKRRSEQPKASI